MSQQAKNGELVATLIATSTADTRSKIVEITTSKLVVDSLTRNKGKREAEGFLRQSNDALIRAIYAKIRERKARTAIKLVKSQDGHIGSQNAKKLAREGAKKMVADVVPTTVDPKWVVSGASLSAMTQKLAYHVIRTRKQASTRPRPRTVVNLELVREGLQEAFGVDKTEAEIWKSIRSKHISGMCAQFLWKTLHDVYMVGKHWLREGMPEEYQDRGICAVCNNIESMDHILFRCEAPGQAEIWEELKKLWTTTGLPWKAPDWGTALGAGCAVFKTEGGARRPPMEALWAILWSESVHLIWKLRCERVIQRDGAIHDKSAVRNAWYATIERRLTLDRRTSVLAKGKHDLK
ncbi:hypothetical protein DICSQDRAFT_55889 [Dichomitus squalens LYAD-421 SS1]|uniref:uncharacterized protein n=1 Tax=Dichomitus squalens (strain LYAD-421) TaxID=732165 RepID=UPI000441411B|nr:uncharacterized protein DICSQDRAFT_55889 [Dichomitus squalens LYAD-421 SS1]EJF63491.1 hypothetical protein DICSQDRAFT_55889 [Dichomitus squalens LYAD-421 SS1]